MFFSKSILLFSQFITFLLALLMVLPNTMRNTTYDPVLSEAPWFVKTQYACAGCVVTGYCLSGMESAVAERSGDTALAGGNGGCPKPGPPRQGESGVVAAALQKWSWCVLVQSYMECGGRAQRRHRFGWWQWRMPETRAAASGEKRRRCRRTPKMVMVRVGAVIYGVRWQSAAATPLWLVAMADAGNQGRRVRGKAASLPPHFKNGSGGACYLGGGVRLCDNTDKFRGSRPAAFRQFQGEQTWRRKT